MPSRLAQQLLREFLARCTPVRVLLYGEKRDPSSDAIRALDFCLVLPACDKDALARTLYLAIDAPVPFGLKLYTRAEWEEALLDPSSFAAAIARKGTVLYEQEP